MSEKEFDLWIDPDRLTAFRVAANFSSDLDLAEAAGLGVSTITKQVRQRKTAGFSSRTLLALTSALTKKGLDITPCDLLEWKGFTPRKQKKVVKITV